MLPHVTKQELVSQVTHLCNATYITKPSYFLLMYDMLGFGSGDNRVVQSCHLLVCLFIYRHFTAKLAISEYDRWHLFVIYYAYLILTYCWIHSKVDKQKNKWQLWTTLMLNNANPFDRGPTTIAEDLDHWGCCIVWVTALTGFFLFTLINHQQTVESWLRQFLVPLLACKMTRCTAGTPKANSNNKGPQQTNHNNVQKRAGTSKLKYSACTFCPSAWPPPCCTPFSYAFD